MPRRVFTTCSFTVTAVIIRHAQYAISGREKAFCKRRPSPRGSSHSAILTDGVQDLRPTRQKTGHLGDVQTQTNDSKQRKNKKSPLRTAHMCVRITVLHNAAQNIFRLILQTITIAQMSVVYWGGVHSAINSVIAQSRQRELTNVQDFAKDSERRAVSLRQLTVHASLTEMQKRVHTVCGQPLVIVDAVRWQHERKQVDIDDTFLREVVVQVRTAVHLRIHTCRRPGTTWR